MRRKNSTLKEYIKTAEDYKRILTERAESETDEESLARIREMIDYYDSYISECKSKLSGNRFSLMFFISLMFLMFGFLVFYGSGGLTGLASLNESGTVLNSSLGSEIVIGQPVKWVKVADSSEIIIPEDAFNISIKDMSGKEVRGEKNV